MRAQNERSRLFLVWIAILLIGVVVGLFTTYRVVTTGLVLYSANDVIVWTLPLATYAFFSLTSVGLALTASIPLVFDIEQYKPLGKRAVILALAALVAAMVSMFLELGTPWHIYAYFTSPNIKSSLWWLGVFYPLQLVFLIILFQKLRAGKGHKPYGLIVLLLAIAIASTLGSTFGFTEARPIFYGPFMPIYFLLTAILDGLAALLLVSLVLYRLRGADHQEGAADVYDGLARYFGVVIGLSLLFFVWRTFMGLYANSPEYAGVKQAIGLPAYQFTLWLGLVVPLVMMIFPGVRQTLWGKITAGVLVLWGAFTANVLIIEWGMVVPPGPRATQFPRLVTPTYTIWEWLVFVFALAVGLLLYSLGERYLQLGSE